MANNGMFEDAELPTWWGHASAVAFTGVGAWALSEGLKKEAKKL